MSESWIPDGFHTITPNIIVDDAEGAISFFKEAFGVDDDGLLLLRGRIRSALASGRGSSSFVAIGPPDEDQPTRLALIRPVLADDGSIDGVVVVVRDDPPVEERLRAEHGHEFEALAASLPDIILRFDVRNYTLFTPNSTENRQEYSGGFAVFF